MKINRLPILSKWRSVGWLLLFGARAASGQSTFAVAYPPVAPPTQVVLTATPDWQPTLRTVPVAAPRLAGAQAQLVAIKDSLARLQRAATSAAPPTTSARTAATPQVLNRFFGYALPGTPNDDDLAVANDGTVLSVMNNRLAVHAEDGTLLRSQNLAALSSTPGVRGFDPRVLYDPGANRFVVVFLSGNVAAESVVHVAVSASADPQGAWHSYQLSGSPLNDGTWLDYPNILLTQDELFISGNTFTDGSTNNSGFRQSVVWQLNEQKLLSGQALQSADVRYYHGITDNGQPVFNLTPVRNGTGPGALPAHFLSSEALSAQNSQRLLLVKVGAGLSAAPNLEVKACSGMLPYTLPPDVRQLGSPLTLSRNDARVMSAFQHNQRIHFVLNTLQTTGPPRAGICYGQITNLAATTPSVQAQLLPEVREAAFPAIAYCGRTAAENSVLVVYSHASPTEHVGYSAVFINDAGDLSAPVNLHIGDDYIAIWGDYLGLSVRYNHPGEVWAQGCVPVATGLGGGGERRPHISRLTHPGVVTATRPAGVRPPLVAYPNPATEYVLVEFQQERGGRTHVSLLDPRGQTVAELLHDWVRAGRTTLRFATTSLPAGLYVVRVESPHEKPQTHRLVVLKP